MDKQKVYYASKAGTFELDAITALVPDTSKVEKPLLNVIMGATTIEMVFASIECRDNWRTRIEQEMGIVHDVAPVLDMGVPIPDDAPVLFATAVPVGAQGISGVEMAAQLRAASPQSVPDVPDPMRGFKPRRKFGNNVVEKPGDIAQAVIASVLHANRDEPPVPVPDSGFEKQVPLGTNGMTQGGPASAEPDPGKKRELGYCVAAGCMSPVGPVDILCAIHTEPPIVCKMAGCVKAPGHDSIVCQEHADTLNSAGRVDAG